MSKGDATRESCIQKSSGPWTLTMPGIIGPWLHDGFPPELILSSNSATLHSLSTIEKSNEHLVALIGRTVLFHDPHQLSQTLNQKSRSAGLSTRARREPGGKRTGKPQGLDTSAIYRKNCHDMALEHLTRALRFGLVFCEALSERKMKDIDTTRTEISRVLRRQALSSTIHRQRSIMATRM